MKSMMTNDIYGIDAESFVIKLFDSIKCAAALGAALEIKLNREEVLELGPHIEKVNWIEINEEGGDTNI